MCKCNPSIRTPFCEHCKFSDNTSPSETYCSNSALGKLKETLEMLEYSHTTSEVYYDYKKVSEFIGDVYKYLENVNDQTTNNQ